MSNFNRIKQSGPKLKDIHGGLLMQVYYYIGSSFSLREIRYDLLIHRRLLRRQYPVQSMQNNNSSKLDHSKIRKFQDEYAKFYEKSKSNKKLKISIMEAENKLRQNGEDTAIFQNMKMKMMKRISKVMKEGEQLIQDGVNSTSQKSFSSNFDGQLENMKNKYKSSIEKKSKNIQSQKQSNQLGNFFESRQSKIHNERQELIPELVMRQVKSSFQNQMRQLPELQKKSRSCFSKKQQPQKNESKQKQANYSLQINQLLSESLVMESIKEKESIKKEKLTNKPKKLIKKNLRSQQLQSKDKKEIFNESLIQKIQDCLNNRQKLIQVLQNYDINPLNIKSILDLGVVNILKNGSPSTLIQQILEFLKIVLLFKYFPQDIKIKKKYHRLLRKRVQSFKQQQKLQQQSEVNSSNQMELRKKTLIKLQNILRGKCDLDSKEYAIKIQCQIENRDKSIGRQYKFLAYSVLRRLKDCPQTLKEIMVELQIDHQ